MVEMASETSDEAARRGTIRGVVGSEFQRKTLGLSHDNPTIFGEPQVGGIWLIYVAYRVILALYVVSVMLYCAISRGSIYYLIYFTNWSYIALACSVTMQAATCIYHYVKKYKKIKTGTHGSLYKSTPLLLKITWIVYTIASGSALVTTCIYWTILYKGKAAVDFVNVNTHASNLAIVLLDHFITGIPIRILHMYQGMIWGTIYTLFSVVYWAAKGTNEHGDPFIYSILNWQDSPGLAAGVTLGLVFLGVPLIQIFFWMLYLVRVSLYELCKRKQQKYNIEMEMGASPAKGELE